jgi:hypothetical protein
MGIQTSILLVIFRKWTRNTGSFWKMACTLVDSMPLAQPLRMYVSISSSVCVCVCVCVLSLCVLCVSHINEEEETFRLYLTSCQVCAVLVRWEGEKALCALLSYITTSSTCMYDEQPYRVCVSINSNFIRIKYKYHYFNIIVRDISKRNINITTI